jgi:hypothetical protein
VIDHQNEAGELGDSIMFVYDGGSIAPEQLPQPSNDPEVRALAFVDPLTSTKSRLDV